MWQFLLSNLYNKMNKHCMTLWLNLTHKDMKTLKPGEAEKSRQALLASRQSLRRLFHVIPERCPRCSRRSFYNLFHWFSGRILDLVNYPKKFKLWARYRNAQNEVLKGFMCVIRCEKVHQIKFPNVYLIEIQIRWTRLDYTTKIK